MLDTDVLVAAVGSPEGASRWWLERILARQTVMAASAPLFFEYEAVLTRPEILARAGADQSTMIRLLRGLALVVDPVTIHYRWRPAAPDPADDMVIEGAVNGRADVILTFNLRHIAPAARRFGVPAMRPGDAAMASRSGAWPN